MHSTHTEIAVNPHGLVPVAVKTLQPSAEFDFDLYLWPTKNKPPSLYREKHIPLERADIERLLDQSVTTLYTRLSEAQHYCDYVRKHVVSDESRPAKDRYCILKDATRTVLTALIETRDIDGTLSASADLARDMVTLICNRPNVLNDLLSVMTHDYYTFTHMTNVCTCCLVLAEAYGIREHAQLTAIAQGAILHDLGKCFVPTKLLNKTTPLTRFEQLELRQHPVRGFAELCQRPDLSWGQLMMVYQHHERFDGRGYPAGLVGREIHEWALICAVADVYDAITRDRAYRKGADPKDALEYLDRESGRSFDEGICQCWIATLKQYQR